MSLSEGCHHGDCFLLALAFAMWIRTHQGLPGVVTHSLQWKKSPSPLSQSCGSNTGSWPFIHSFGFRLLFLPCPRLWERTMTIGCYFWLDLPRELRRFLWSLGKHNRLFLFCHSKNSRSVSDNTISYWLRSVLRQAYSEVSSEVLALTEISTLGGSSLSPSILCTQRWSLKMLQLEDRVLRPVSCEVSTETLRRHTAFGKRIIDYSCLATLRLADQYRRTLFATSYVISQAYSEVPSEELPLPEIEHMGVGLCRPLPCSSRVCH